MRYETVNSGFHRARLGRLTARRAIAFAFSKDESGGDARSLPSAAAPCGLRFCEKLWVIGVPPLCAICLRCRVAAPAPLFMCGAPRTEARTQNGFAEASGALRYYCSKTYPGLIAKEHGTDAALVRNGYSAAGGPVLIRHGNCSPQQQQGSPPRFEPPCACIVICHCRLRRFCFCGFRAAAPARIALSNRPAEALASTPAIDMTALCSEICS
mmetsp:Transcript_24753/g.79961  ORF Transcript_24753/g.79961 Transcript_24753/m.79961 type:complete len:212 (-) Transcript_24753:89-724(-)